MDNLEHPVPRLPAYVAACAEICCPDISHLSNVIDYRPMVDNIDPVAALLMIIQSINMIYPTCQCELTEPIPAGQRLEHRGQ